MLDHNYNAGEKVRVDDGVHKFTGTIVGPDPKNTAQYEITSDATPSRTWTVHWAYITRG